MNLAEAQTIQTKSTDQIKLVVGRKKSKNPH
jgi:hypothetical protein